MKKFFRLHRGGFAESMETAQEVQSLADVRAILDGMFPKGYLSNIRIDSSVINDPRTAGYSWGADTYMVVADFDCYNSQCLGYVNFPGS